MHMLFRQECGNATQVGEVNDIISYICRLCPDHFWLYIHLYLPTNGRKNAIQFTKSNISNTVRFTDRVSTEH